MGDVLLHLRGHLLRPRHPARARKQGADTWTFSLGAGLGYSLTEDAWLSAGVFYTPLWVTRPPRAYEERDSLVNFRASLTYRIW